MTSSMPDHVMALQAQSLGLSVMDSLASVYNDDNQKILYVSYLWSVELFYFHAPLILCGVRCKSYQEHDETRIAILYATTGSDRRFDYRQPSPSYVKLYNVTDPVSQAITDVNLLQTDGPIIPGDSHISFKLRTWSHSANGSFHYTNNKPDNGVTELWNAIYGMIGKVVGVYDDTELKTLIDLGPRH